MEWITVAGVGVVCFVVALWMMWRKYFPKFRIVLMLVAGFCAAGFFADAARWIAEKADNASSRVGQMLFGSTAAGIGVACGVVILLELIHATHPKRGRPQMWHPPLAFLAPALLGVAGGVFATLASTGDDFVAEFGRMINSIL